MASCDLGYDCSSLISAALGYIKEIGDLLALIPGGVLSKVGLSEFSVKVDAFLKATSILDSIEDLEANREGLKCKSDGKDCSCCCKEKFKVY